jgi:FkbM family methyltransferase
VHRSLVKYRVKRMIAPLGVRFRPGANARQDLAACVDHLYRRGIRPATVIDVGVADGTFELYEGFPDARFLLIEPMSEFDDTLRFVAKRYGATVVRAAADDAHGELQISVLDDLHGVSLLRADGIHQRTVPTVRVDDVCRQEGLEGPYVLKVDVQGAELRVLDGAPRVLAQCAVVILETSLFEFTPGMPQIADVVAYLGERGMVPYDIFSAYTRPLDGALAQVDVAFVPRDSPLRASHAFSDGKILARPVPPLTRLRRLARM